MKLLMLSNITRGDRELTKDTVYEVADIVGKDYIIEVPMKQKGKTKRVLVFKEEGELVD